MSVRPTQQHGMTLIELMVAMVLGIIVTGGIISLFVSTHRANDAQRALARMQEEGRYAVTTFTDDLRMANATYCSNTGGLATASSTAFMLHDRLRAPTIQVATLTLPDNTTPFATAPTAPYPLPSSFFMRGYECGASTCTPAAPTGLPAMGTNAGDRVVGADVLTMRYLNGEGWSIGTGNSSQVCNATGGLTQINLAPATSASPPIEPPITDFTGNVALLADCSLSQVFAVTGAGTNTLTVNAAGNFALASPQCADISSDARVFDFTTDFMTVTYYLQLQADENPDAPVGSLVAVLMRSVNGGAAQEIIRGVGRLDFRYGIENSNGATAYLTANQVDAINQTTTGVLTCPPGAPNGLYETDPVTYNGAGCLWRAVKAIEVNMLVTSVDRMPMPDSELAYFYAPDGSSMQTPPTTMPNGLSRQLMRRGFTNIIAIRNYNP